LDDFDEVFNDVLPSFVGDDGGRQVTQNVGAHRLDRVQVLLLEQEEIDDVVSALGMIEEDEK